MGDWSDFDMPEFFCETTPRARKTHRCCECYGDISPGERYQKIVGKWCGDFATFKVCEPCQRLRSWAEDHKVYACFSELHETIENDELEVPAMVVIAMQAN